MRFAEAGHRRARRPLGTTFHLSQFLLAPAAGASSVATDTSRGRACRKRRSREPGMRLENSRAGARDDHSLFRSARRVPIG